MGCLHLADDLIQQFGKLFRQQIYVHLYRCHPRLLEQLGQLLRGFFHMGADHDHTGASLLHIFTHALRRNRLRRQLRQRGEQARGAAE